MLKKTLRTVAIAIIAISLLTTIVPLDADAARVRLRSGGGASNEIDVKVVDAFTGSFETFYDDVVRTPQGESPSANSISALETNNDVLQAHSFKDLNEEYLTAAEGVKQEAENVVSVAEEVNSSPYRGAMTNDTIDAAMQAYNAQLNAMTSAVGLYENQADERREDGNQIFMYIMIGLGIVVALVIIGLIVYTTKKSHARRLAMFANDPNAGAIPKATQVVLADLLNGLYQYEKDFKKNDAALMTNTKKFTYDLYQIQASDPSLGTYRSIVLEYAALIAMSAHDPARATELLDQAAQAKGNRDFYTETARNFTNTPS